MRRRQTEEGVQLVQVRRHLRPRQHVADDDVAQRVADEADPLGGQVEGLDVVGDLLRQPVRQRVKVGERVTLSRGGREGGGGGDVLGGVAQPWGAEAGSRFQRYAFLKSVKVASRAYSDFFLTKSRNERFALAPTEGNRSD